MRCASFVQLLLLLFVSLENRNIYAFAETEFGLNFDPPTDNSVKVDEHDNNKVPGDKVAKVAAVALQRIVPPVLVYEKVTNLMKKIDQKMELMDSTEYTTAFGMPCNPNEAKFCFKRTTSASTTEEPPSSFKQRRERRNIPYPQQPSHVEPSDYDLPPAQVTEFNQVIAQAREAFDRQTAIANELEAERKKRAFLSYINEATNEQGDQELVSLDSPKLIEAVAVSPSKLIDYKKKKTDTVERVLGREEAVRLRGWFPDYWTSHNAKPTTVEKSRRRRLDTTSKKQRTAQSKTRRCLQGMKKTDGIVVPIDQPLSDKPVRRPTTEESEVTVQKERAEEGEIPVEKGRGPPLDQRDDTQSGKQNEQQHRVSSSSSPSSSFAATEDAVQSGGSIGRMTSDSTDVSVAEKEEEKQGDALLVGTSWMERWIPRFVYEHFIIPELIANWFSQKGDEACECWEEGEEEVEEYYEDEEDFDDFEFDKESNDILAIQFISVNDNYYTSDAGETVMLTAEATPTMTISLSLPTSSMESLNFPSKLEASTKQDSTALPELDQVKLESSEMDAKPETTVNVKSGQTEAHPFIHRAGLGPEGIYTYLRRLRDSSSGLLDDKREGERPSIEVEAVKALTEQTTRSHLFRDFRQIPFDLVSAMLPPFLQLEDFSIGHFFTPKNKNVSTIDENVSKIKDDRENSIQGRVEMVG